MVHEVVLIVVGAAIAALVVATGYDVGFSNGVDKGSTWMLEVLIGDGFLDKEKVEDRYGKGGAR